MPHVYIVRLCITNPAASRASFGLIAATCIRPGRRILIHSSIAALVRRRSSAASSNDFCRTGLSRGRSAYQTPEDQRRFRISVVPGWADLQDHRGLRVAGSRVASWLWRQCVASQHSSRLPQRDHLESLMHYSGTKICACVMPSWDCIRRADPFLCPPSPSFVHISIVQGLLPVSLLCTLSIVISCLLFLWIPLRSVHSCRSVERISHTPLETSATLTSCATHRRTTPTTLLPSRQPRGSNRLTCRSVIPLIDHTICFIPITVHCTTITRG